MMYRFKTFDTKSGLDPLNKFIREEPTAHISCIDYDIITVSYTSSCKHLRARVTGSERVGNATCPDCGEVYFGEVLNNFLNEMRSVLGVE